MNDERVRRSLTAWLRFASRSKLTAVIALVALGLCSFLYLNQQPDYYARYSFLLDKSSENEAGCKLPNPDPWDPTIREYVSDAPPLDCRQIQPTLSYLRNSVLYLNQTGLELSGYSLDALNCRHRCFTWANDVENQFEEWKDFINGTEVRCEFVEVTCTKKLLPITVYHKHHAQIVQNATPSESVNQRYSVSLIVVDSVSQSHWRRGLKKTLNVLETMYNTVVMKGFGKVADNSFPNAVAFLTGLDIRSDKLPGPETGGKFDDWPLIWKDFEKAGHVTYYSEDYPAFNLFNYLSKGFSRPPVTHYFRPYWLQVYASMVYRRSTYLCYNTDPMHQLQLDYYKQFVNNYAKKRPFFAVNWFTELAHDRLAQVSVADDDFAAMLTEQRENLADTFFFALADHGHRFDPIRQTMIGRLEERMPFFSMHVPDKLLASVPGLKATLAWNARQLSSFYDLYVTLHDILDLNERNAWHELEQNGPPERSVHRQPVERFRKHCPRGLSLLRPLPSTRTCADAGIPEEYCICQTEKSIPIESEVVHKAATELVDELNRQLAAQPKCAKLSLTNIRGASSALPNSGLIKATSTSMFPSHSYSRGVYVNYLVMVEVAPSGAVFEATIRHDLAADALRVVGQPNRINRYGNQSICIDQPVLRKYCYCQTS